MRTISLGGALLVIWLLLSGHYDALLIGFGVLSCALVAAIAARMDLVDREGHPIFLISRALRYWPWLVWEIVKANWDVARRALGYGLDISPTLLRVSASQKTDLGRVIYANSITLTPGTVSIDVDGGTILVHALSRDGAAALEEGEMDRRVTRMMGEAR